MTMDSSSSMSTYRPQSPDLSSYAPQSPDLSGVAPPPAPATFASAGFYDPSAAPAAAASAGSLPPPGSHFPGYQIIPAYHLPPGAAGYPAQHTHFAPPPQDPHMMPGHHYHVNHEAGYLPDAPLTRSRRGQSSTESTHPFNGHALHQPAHIGGPSMHTIKTEVTDPTYGVQLKTSFPVARIKRIMQADEDIGKVAQVTPHVVSRALELFMIKLITASASQAQGGTGGGAKGQKRIMAQHLKRVIMTDDSFDFLREIAGKVPDAPAKGKKEATSDSDEAKPGKRKGKKRKDSGDDF